MLLSDYVNVFLLGLLGSGHCVGMCGALAVAASAGPGGRGALIARQVVYQIGKATSYVFIGVLLLLAGQWLEARAAVERFQNIVGLVTGVLMILAGLVYVLEVRIPPLVLRWWQGSAACGALSGVWRSPSLFKSLLVGWVNGFLPCGLSLTAMLMLVSFGTASGVVIGSYVFGLGTLPSLLAAAWLGKQLGASSRRWLVRLSGVALIVFGVLTLVRGRPEVHDWMHRHLMPAGSHGEHQHTE